MTATWDGFSFSPSSLFFPLVPKEGGLIKKKTKKKKTHHRLKEALPQMKASSLWRGSRQPGAERESRAP